MKYFEVKVEDVHHLKLLSHIMIAEEMSIFYTIHNLVGGLAHACLESLKCLKYQRLSPLNSFHVLSI